MAIFPTQIQIPQIIKQIKFVKQASTVYVLYYLKICSFWLSPKLKNLDDALDTSISGVQFA